MKNHTFTVIPCYHIIYNFVQFILQLIWYSKIANNLDSITLMSHDNFTYTVLQEKISMLQVRKSKGLPAVSGLPTGQATVFTKTAQPLVKPAQ